MSMSNFSMPLVSGGILGPYPFPGLTLAVVYREGFSESDLVGARTAYGESGDLNLGSRGG